MLRRLAVFVIIELLAMPLPRSASAQTGRLTGLWEGVEHGESRDKPVAVLLTPRGDEGFGGRFYFEGEDFGALQDGHQHGDSLVCHVGTLRFQARLREPDVMALRVTVRAGKIHEVVLTHTSSDTTRVPARVLNAAAIPPRDSVPAAVLHSYHQARSGNSATAGCLDHGTLLLVGGGSGTAEIFARFVTLAGGPNAKIVVIPTASVNSTDPTVARELGRRMQTLLGVSSVTVLHTTSRAEANSARFVEPLRHATGVWIPGGEALWLRDAYLGTRTDSELVALIGRGGVVGGSSAGAVIWGSQMLLDRARPGASPFEIEKPEDVLIGNPREAAFGLMRNTLVTPHFTQFGTATSVDRLLPAYPGLMVLGIDEDTAIEVHANAFTVIGSGTVSVYDSRHSPATPVVLRASTRYNLQKRTQVRP